MALRSRSRRWTRHLRLLKALGAPVFIAAECTRAVHGQRGASLNRRPRLSAGDWPRFGARLSALAAYTAERGLTFAYHFHLGTVVEGEDDLGRFLDATTDEVGLVVDTGHAALGGVDAARLIGEHPGRVAHVHAKDVRGAVADRVRAEGRSFLDGVLGGMFTAPGDGDLDFAPVMRALADIGYRGWIVEEAEQDPARADPQSLWPAGPGHPSEGRRGRGPRPGAGGRGAASMTTLRVRPRSPDAKGLVTDVTPSNAGWRYVGFQVRHLRKGQTVDVAFSGREACIVVLAGAADIERGRPELRARRRAKLGVRGRRAGRGLCARQRPDPHHSDHRRGDRAVHRAGIGRRRGAADHAGPDEPGDPGRRDQPALRAQHPARDRAGREPAGGRGDHASRPLVELSAAQARRRPTAGGDASSRRLTITASIRPQGFAFQRVYTDDRTLDETICVEDGDVVLVPRGYHPVGAPHGYRLYYLNVMAGPKRRWIFHDDPAHAWIKTAT